MPQRQKFAVRATWGMRIHLTHWRRLPLRWVIVTALALLLASCGGEPRLSLPPSPTPQPAAAPTIPAMAATPAPLPPSVGAVVWADAIDPSTNKPAAVTSYPADAPQLIAAIETTALPAGSNVEAAWSYNHTTLDALTTRLTTDKPAETQWLSFSLNRDPNVPWPAGMYEITITLNGAVVQTSLVEVVAAE